MAAKSKSKQEEAMQFLDDLDSLSPAPPAQDNTQSSSQPPHEGEAADVLKFLDEITQKSSEPTRVTAAHLDRPASRASTPGLKKSTERVRVGTPTPSLAAQKGEGVSSSTQPTTRVAATQDQAPVQPSSGWGWGTVWSTASAAIQQAKTVVDEQVKHLPQPEQAKKWSEGLSGYVKKEQLEKLGKDFRTVGLSTLTDILNVVAPPISEHEVIQVWLSHDMQGYEGVESLVYRALARIMEQVEGGDLIVNKGSESRPKDPSPSTSRNLNAVDGLDAAIKLAHANVQDLIKSNVKPVAPQASSSQNPTTHSYVYLRIQPFYSNTLAAPLSEAKTGESAEQSHLQFILHLSDPDHQLDHTTVTQAVPGRWIELWDKHDWIEELVVEVLRVGIEVIGQEYVVSRMGWASGQATDAQKEAPVPEEPKNAT
ncbi:hypothetical protein BD410DRAFT_738554 [Rickenella mellea]|uniref:Maintenance of telomere capping protein 1 n=1 Tax=Rickenella mellea TaxID=50990 RepID=A0A4Y7QNH3_9AGAM|nr:hypothetical protein BD410DRAFT_738554 [Rickenella mellea]